jgi:hypothetical protein
MRGNRLPRDREGRALLPPREPPEEVARADDLASARCPTQVAPDRLDAACVIMLGVRTRNGAVDEPGGEVLGM